jgi:transposase
MSLEVVKHEEVKRGFVLLPRRWVVERDFAWASRFRRLMRRITSGFPPLWQSCTLWRLLASSSRRQRASSSRVHNMF